MTSLTIPTLGAWLQPLLNTVVGHNVLVAYARQPDMPDRCLTVMQYGGGKDRYEGMFEEIPFRFQSRGREESVEDSQLIANAADEIVFELTNTMIGEVYVTSAWAVNKPKQMPMTDSQSRYQFTADYLFLASRYN